MISLYVENLTSFKSVIRFLSIGPRNGCFILKDNTLEFTKIDNENVMFSFSLNLGHTNDDLKLTKNENNDTTFPIDFTNLYNLIKNRRKDDQLIVNINKYDDSRVEYLVNVYDVQNNINQLIELSSFTMFEHDVYEYQMDIDFKNEYKFCLQTLTNICQSFKDNDKIKTQALINDKCIILSFIDCTYNQQERKLVCYREGVNQNIKSSDINNMDKYEIPRMVVNIRILKDIINRKTREKGSIYYSMEIIKIKIPSIVNSGYSEISLFFKPI